MTWQTAARYGFEMCLHGEPSADLTTTVFNLSSILEYNASWLNPREKAGVRVVRVEANLGGSALRDPTTQPLTGLLRVQAIGPSYSSQAKMKIASHGQPVSQVLNSNDGPGAKR